MDPNALKVINKVIKKRKVVAQSDGLAMLSAGLHEITFPPRDSKDLFVLVLSCPAQKQNPKDFAVPLGTPKPMDSALTPALSIAVVTHRLFRLKVEKVFSD